jgi:hypothetical protein
MEETPMKKLIGVAVLALTPLSFALAGAPDKDHPPQKATDEATPEMKNPGGTDKLHPPQKAMDEATPVEKKGDKAAAAGSSGGASQTEAAPSWDTRKAGEGVSLTGSKQ